MKAFLNISLLICVVFAGFSQQKSMVQFTISDELPSNQISSITQDDLGFIWVMTTEGLAQYNGYYWTSFTSEESKFASLEFESNKIDTTQIEPFIRGQISEQLPISYFKDDQGSVWIGTQEEGLYYFPKETAVEKSDVVFEFIGFNNKIVRTVETQIEVDHKFQTLSIAYTTLDFTSKIRTNFRYKIDGIHKDWVLTRDPKVQFTSLPDRGVYLFTIQVKKKDGSWGSEATLQLKFLTPFYETYLFIGALIALVLMALILGIRWFFRRKLRLEQLQSKLKQLEGKALQSQMNPHFVFNALNSIQSFIATGQTMRSEVYLSKFSSLLRKTLQNSRSNSISLSQEIENVETYLELEKMRFEDRLQYEIKIDESLEQDLVAVPPMLLQPFVENAIIHGLAPKKEGGNIQIHVVPVDNHSIKYIVLDNGVGRKSNPSTDHVSLGTDLVRQRLSLHTHLDTESLVYKDLTDETGKATGTQVELIVPII